MGDYVALKDGVSPPMLVVDAVDGIEVVTVAYKVGGTLEREWDLPRSVLKRVPVVVLRLQ